MCENCNTKDSIKKNFLISRAVKQRNNLPHQLGVSFLSLGVFMEKLSNCQECCTINYHAGKEIY